MLLLSVSQMKELYFVNIFSVPNVHMLKYFLHTCLFVRILYSNYKHLNKVSRSALQSSAVVEGAAYKLLSTLWTVIDSEVASTR